MLACSPVVATLLTQRASTAEPAPLDLRWDAPAGCPAAARVRARVNRLTGSVRRQVKADAQVQREGAAFRLTLRTEVDGVAGARELRAPDCASLADAAALILALMADPAATAEAPPAGSESSSAPVASSAPGVAPDGSAPSATASSSAGPVSAASSAPAASSASAASSVEPASPVISASPLRWGASLGASLDASLGPGPGVGPAVSIEVSGARWEVAWWASWQPARAALVAGHPTAAADLSWLSSGLRGCVAPLERLRWAQLCGGGGALRIAAAGRGVSETRSGVALVPALTAGLQARLPLGGALHLEPGLDATAPLRRASFVLENAGPAHRLPVVGFGARVALVWSFSI